MLFSSVECELRIAYDFIEKVTPIITSMGLNEQSAVEINYKNRKKDKDAEASLNCKPLWNVRG
jgi:hypothetical protein